MDRQDKRRHLRRWLALFLSIVMLGSLMSCGDEEALETEVAGEASGESEKSGDAKAGAETNGGASKTGERSSSSQSSAGSVMRRVRKSEAPMGEDETWTLFVYLCGADLESENGMASGDLQEMMNSGANDQVRYVVETGGASYWSEDVDPDTIGRYVIANGNLELVDTEPLSSMGDSSTLASFLKWGVENYPARNMGLVIWDHGSGSINGACFDELYDDDSLSLKEMDAALFSVYDSMTEPFAFIGFDACLMSTVETAAILATHAKYMIASQELEPGYGWDFTAIGDYLAEHPGAGPEELGRVICDSYYAACEAIWSESSATLALTDLSKIDALISDFDALSKDVYEYVEGDGSYAAMSREVASADNYGGNNRTEGYTNMVDLGGIVDASEAISDKASSVRDAIDQAVVYQVKGEDHAEACGLSIYYPLELMGSQELSVFKNVCISSYYLGLINMVAYGAVNEGDFSEYEGGGSILDLILNYTGDDYYYDDSEDSYIYEPEEDDTFDFVNGYEVSDESSAITFDQAPALDENGSYGFVLSEEGIENAQSVESYVMLSLGDEEEYAGSFISLGITGDVQGDWETGEFADNFDGYWFTLPDGTPLSVMIVEECDGYDIYTSPVLLNGDETYLRFVWNYTEGNAYIQGTWDGIEDDGASSRHIRKLAKGDVLEPEYMVFDFSDDSTDDEPETFTIDKYTYDGDNSISFMRLEDGKYLYGFYVNDIYGNYYTSDPVFFTVEGEKIYFSEE